MKYKIPFVNFPAQYNEHKEEYDEALQDVIQRGDLILRKDLETFERNFAQVAGAKYAVGVASGTDALLLTMKALGIGMGDEVITCSYTFRATIEAIIHAGATPVLADLEEDWRKYKTVKTKAIIPAHLEGVIVDWEPDNGIHMIEDSCQALMAKPLTGIAAAYSFYPAKILGCLGDGGAIVTNDEQLAESLKTFRNHDKGTWNRVAYNSRLDNLQAAFLNVRLKYILQIIQRRLDIARIYDMELPLNINTPKPRGVYQDYIISCPERDELFDFLEDAGVQTMKNGYPFPTGITKKPMAASYEEESLRLPCNETLTDEDVMFVVEKVKEFYG